MVNYIQMEPGKIGGHGITLFNGDVLVFGGFDKDILDKKGKKQLAELNKRLSKIK